VEVSLKAKEIAARLAELAEELPPHFQAKLEENRIPIPLLMDVKVYLKDGNPWVVPTGGIIFAPGADIPETPEEWVEYLIVLTHPKETVEDIEAAWCDSIVALM